ncbi:uncharacterized protein LOC114239885 [Bombyx mandarina]|uniref:Uncharacterized protein LOC114239885 n=1 Tax=Bombyx mandarina TaxID=7092 RepID=A0A6J2J9I2_BOMMA|nr:uncharacterized protein LOC114239885 [Bombyx mandarina]
MINSYTFNQPSKTANTWTCSSRTSVQACKARVIKDAEIKYEIIKTNRGVHLLMIDSYTFNKTSRMANTWTCSSRMSQCCKAKLIIHGDTIKSCFLGHNHPPPHYMKTANGVYIKVV